MVILLITSKLSLRRKKENHMWIEQMNLEGRVYSGKSNAVNKPIYVQKVYAVNVGIKCMETIQKTGMKSIHSKTMQVFQLIYQKKQSTTNYTTLLDPIIKSSENLKPILVHIVEIAQKVEKKSVRFYLIYPKSHSKLEHEEMLFHADVSDEDDRVNSQDASSTSMTCNNRDLLTPLFNTNTDIKMTNDFSSILNNPLYSDESFDRKNICLECNCICTDVCIRCEQNGEFEIAQTIDKQKNLQQDNDNDSISYRLT